MLEEKSDAWINSKLQHRLPSYIGQILVLGRFCTDLAALAPYYHHDFGPIILSKALALGYQGIILCGNCLFVFLCTASVIKKAATLSLSK